MSQVLRSTWTKNSLRLFTSSTHRTITFRALWQLQSAYITSKEEGNFFSDSNKVYYFDATLDVDKHYRIECTVNVEARGDEDCFC